ITRHNSYQRPRVVEPSKLVEPSRHPQTVSACCPHAAQPASSDNRRMERLAASTRVRMGTDGMAESRGELRSLTLYPAELRARCEIRYLALRPLRVERPGHAFLDTGRKRLRHTRRVR